MNDDAFTPRFRGLYRSLAVNLVVPLGAAQLLIHRGIPIVTALALSATVPFVWGGVEIIRSHRVDPVAALSLLLIAGGVLASLVSGDARLALAKESFATGLFAVVCLGSLLAPRPLMFIFGREFSAGADAARRTAWEELWRSAPRFRGALRLMTIVWGVAYALEAAARFAMAYSLPPAMTLLLSPVLDVGVTVALIVWTLGFVRRARRRGSGAPEPPNPAP